MDKYLKLLTKCHIETSVKQMHLWGKKKKSLDSSKTNTNKQQNLCHCRVCDPPALKILLAKRMSAMPSAVAGLSASGVPTERVLNVNTRHTEGFEEKLCLKSCGGLVSLMWRRGFSQVGSKQDRQVLQSSERRGGTPNRTLSVRTAAAHVKNKKVALM